nr:hypothetical protein [Tanacetum cinerariifolium]
MLVQAQEEMGEDDKLKRTKTAQQNEIDGLERRVKKLEKKKRSRTHKLKRLYKIGLTTKVISSSDDEAVDKKDTSKQGRIDEIDVDEDITLVNDQEMFDADKDLQGEEVVFEQEVVVDNEPIVIAAQKRKLQKNINEEERLVGERARQEKEANIALIKTWEDIQAKVDADYQLVERLQAEEQQELNEEEKVKLFMELLEKRRKFFAVKRTEEKRNRLPTKAQQRSLMCTYLKNMDGWKPKALKKKPLLNFKNYLIKQ